MKKYATEEALQEQEQQSLLWDISKQYSPRCDAAKCGVPYGAILFAKKIFIKNL